MKTLLFADDLFIIQGEEDNNTYQYVLCIACQFNITWKRRQIERKYVFRWWDPRQITIVNRKQNKLAGFTILEILLYGVRLSGVRKLVN